MPARKTTRAEVKQQLKDLSQVLKGLVDDLRVQVHLGTMELKADAGPYLTEVSAATQAASKDLIKRGRELKAHLKKLRASHPR